MLHLHCAGFVWNRAFVHDFSLYVQHMHNKVCIFFKTWTIYAQVHNSTMLCIKWLLCIAQLCIMTKSFEHCSYLCYSTFKLCKCALFWAIRTNTNLATISSCRFSFTYLLVFCYQCNYPQTSRNLVVSWMHNFHWIGPKANSVYKLQCPFVVVP